MEQSWGRMKQEENMLEVREMKCTNKICVLIGFCGVKFQELMHKIHAM